MRIDQRGFLFVEGVKVCRVTDTGQLEFKQKPNWKLGVTGNEVVRVDPQEIVTAVEQHTAVTTKENPPCP